MSDTVRILVLFSLIGVTGCAGMVGSRDFIPACATLEETAPDGTATSLESPPELLNRVDFNRRLMARVRARDVPRRNLTAELKLLVQADGTVSHGCVRNGSMDPRFDHAALDAARVARFRPATVDGQPVIAWTSLTATLTVSGGTPSP